MNQAVMEVTSNLDERLKRCVLDVLKLDLPTSAIADETSLYELGLDSLSVVDLLMAIESTFGIAIDVEELSAELFGQFLTLRDFLQQKATHAH
ncbi:acyl carrier protein [Parachitinimonas caeni]|uniref:Acyl carrier protein n=1 Tax=Parachitinimonas caeni TaxID=3031301 RepID=A0ABT7E0V5_9NEIS|nr:acyl carrier protein [Parachitinimonas caeni]MDK2125940.1 acyl carrier protein [Parachitinimonas caeni]